MSRLGTDDVYYAIGSRLGVVVDAIARKEIVADHVHEIEERLHRAGLDSL